MSASVDQIADRIYRISTFVPDIGPSGVTFNQLQRYGCAPVDLPAQPLPAHDAPVGLSSS